MANYQRFRGQVSVVGVSLLLLIVIASVGLVVSIGATASEDTSRQMDEARAEKLLTQFDAKSSMVALGGTSSQSVGLSSDAGQYYVREDAGWMNVTMVNRTDDSRTEMLNVTLGAVTYEGEDSTVAYQGGGVWKRTDGGTTMLSPPEFHFRNATLTLPVILVRGESTLGSSAAVTHERTVQRFPDASADDDWRNPLVRRKVNVTVHSDYYEAWGTFFEQRTAGETAVDHDNQTATATLVTPPGERDITNAIVATSGAGEIRVTGNGARTDSYNSSKGDYAATGGSNGTVTTTGDVYVGGDGRVLGNIRSGKSVKVKGSSHVAGNVSYTTSENVKETNVDGDIRRIDGVSSESPISSYVDIRNDSVRSDNDNDATSVVDGDELDFSGSATLGPGSYYLENLAIDDGDTLTLDTADSNVSIVVRDYVRLEDNSTVEVVGDGRANLYVEGNNPDPISNADFVIDESGGFFDVPGTNSTQLWVYGNRDFEAQISGSSSSSGVRRFEGVIYAPGGSVGNSSLYVKHGEVYGGVVTATVELDQGGAVHYDRALRGSTVLPGDLEIVRITYLHVSTNEVRVEGR